MSELLSLKQAAKYLKVSDFRMRMLLLKDERVTGTKVQEAHFEKWYVEKSELDSYISQRGKMRDGRKAYLARLTPEQVSGMRAYCKKQGIPFAPRYTKKSK